MNQDFKTFENCLDLAKKTVDKLKAEHRFITTVESCTGGALAFFLTNIPGASEVLTDAFITYDKDSKIRLGVSPSILQKHTVYSEEAAVEMAQAGLRCAVHADVAIGITGVLTREDPAHPEAKQGCVYFAIAERNKVLSKKLQLNALPSPEERWLMKCQIVEKVLMELLSV